MVTNVSFETKQYNHGISLWLRIEKNGLTNKKLLGSSFKRKEDVSLFIMALMCREIKGFDSIQ